MVQHRDSQLGWRGEHGVVGQASNNFNHKRHFQAEPILIAFAGVEARSWAAKLDPSKQLHCRKTKAVQGRDVNDAHLAREGFSVRTNNARCNDLSRTDEQLGHGSGPGQNKALCHACISLTKATLHAYTSFGGCCRASWTHALERPSMRARKTSESKEERLPTQRNAARLRLSSVSDAQ